MPNYSFYYIISALLTLYLCKQLIRRLSLSFAKHPSITGHSRMLRRCSQWVLQADYPTSSLYNTDNAPEEIQEKRREAISLLREQFKWRFGQDAERREQLRSSLPDLQFLSQYKVPFPFRNILPKEFQQITIAEHDHSIYLKSPNIHQPHHPHHILPEKNSSNDSRFSNTNHFSLLDASGSYGVNVIGYDYYKQAIESGVKNAASLGPVLGLYHPCMERVLQQLKAISQKTSVSFHMSGTEAVMQAVRQARFQTKKRFLVRFCGAYHGWWDGVQPGIGNLRQSNDILTLTEMSQRTLGVLRDRTDIACVLVNPLQALHPNKNPTSDGALFGRRTLGLSTTATTYNKQDYQQWLIELREVCTQKGIALIFDEVFTGFRLALGGAQAYFKVEADLVTYGKTLGGGLPVGVLCGNQQWMQRYRDTHPMQMNVARGTFNANTYVLNAMDQFLNEITKPQYQTLYHQADECWSQRAHALNKRLRKLNLPIHFYHMQSVFITLYQKPSQYNWLFQYYLIMQGVLLGPYGTGRFIFPITLTDDEFNDFSKRITHAAIQMEHDGWWWTPEGITNRAIGLKVAKTVLQAHIKRLKQRLTPHRFKSNPIHLPNPIANHLPTHLTTHSDNHSPGTPFHDSNAEYKKSIEPH